MSYHKISVFFEMTERNGTVVCYDGLCPMCLKAVSLMRPIWEPRGVEFVPLQAEWVRRRLNLPDAELMGEMRVFTPQGRVLGGADAHGHLWGHVWWLWPLWLASKFPGIHWLIDVSYRWVAANRYRLMPAKDGCDDRCAIPKTDIEKPKTKNERT
jgi:predicted DCC family thiol-disulfide oxidoreductase YuxK